MWRIVLFLNQPEDVPKRKAANRKRRKRGEEERTRVKPVASRYPPHSRLRTAKFCNEILSGMKATVLFGSPLAFAGEMKMISNIFNEFQWSICMSIFVLVSF